MNFSFIKLKYGLIFDVKPCFSLAEGNIIFSVSFIINNLKSACLEKPRYRWLLSDQMVAVLFRLVCGLFPLTSRNPSAFSIFPCVFGFVSSIRIKYVVSFFVLPMSFVIIVSADTAYSISPNAERGGTLISLSR
jgi:hypothetical protein